MSEKRKHQSSTRFDSHLIRGERIFWIGQPDSFRLFMEDDRFLIPIGMILTIIGIFFVLARRLPLIGVIFLLVGLYVLCVRLLYKFWRSSQTHYAVTNYRLLILTPAKTLHAYAINSLTPLRKQIGSDGIGKIVFGEPQHDNQRNILSRDMSNTGLEFLGYTLPGFYDIPEVEEVYTLIEDLRYAAQNLPDEDEQIIHRVKDSRKNRTKVAKKAHRR